MGVIVELGGVGKPRMKATQKGHQRLRVINDGDDEYKVGRNVWGCEVHGGAAEGD